MTRSTGIEEGYKSFDIGPQTIKKFRDVILNSNTVIMNGSMGVFEHEAFAKGSHEVIKALMEVS